ncbi:DUF962 domain-containing protein [Algoriphagus halophytocola]|uniref:DUF962 domain-containing protein n=1 Tax=Algoriphagus halophytocola TaxID=2991499 RepID=A0ABY6MPH9_9BACT|nr:MULTISPECIES: Mpo1-like protein [unclassified Algoriphagus]UZD24296.1 DUF962 domain-containing protein [Algoriphagus sp. TR-M5]WBL41665.1 DUF962 domain-containing protein [Algoriphagus sp. TR-M9]
MRKIDALFQEYGMSHQNSTNKMIHWVCVPAIFFSIVGLIFSIPAEPLVELMPFLGNFANWATVTLFLVLIYYLTLSMPITLGMLFFSAMCLALANFIQLIFPGKLWLISLAIFIISWFLQFYGHKIEGKKPTFLRDLQFLLIGPAWLMHFIYRRLGLSY